jgi:PAS domain S-box-containing protein
LHRELEIEYDLQLPSSAMQNHDTHTPIYQPAGIFSRLILVFSSAVGLMGLAGVTGWFAGVPTLASWSPGFEPMTPMGATLLITWGVATLLHASLPEDAFGRGLFALAGLLTALLGLASLFDLVSGGVGLFSRFNGAVAFGSNHHIAPLAAANWVLIGASSVLLSLRRPRQLEFVVSIVASIILLANLIVLLGYLYGSPLLYGTQSRVVPLPVAVSHSLASLTLLLLLGPEHYPLRFLVGQSARARLLRIFLPMMIIVITLDGVLARLAPRESGASVSTAMSVLVFVGLSVILVYMTTRVSGDSIDRAEALRDEAERQLSATVTMFEGLFNAVPDAVVVVDAKGKIVRVNNQAERAFGWVREELIGMSIETLVPDRFLGKHEGYRAGYTGRPRVRTMGAGFNLYAKRRDGSEFPVDIMLGPLQTELGMLVLSVIHDISDQRRAQSEIESLNRALGRQVSELEAVNKELESFSYSVSHDLRAPLRAVDGFSRILVEDYGEKFDDEGRRVVGIIRDNTRRMGQLIDDLLAFSRLGRQGISKHPIDMTELAQSVIADIKVEFATGAEFRVGDLPEAEGDRAMLRQVFANLIANAAKFSAPKERAIIEVSGYRGDGETVYTVGDNGVGFDMQYAGKLFGVFQRLHRQQEFEGTGVGLAIVQRVVHRHEGRVWAESKLGEGARFSFSLPLLQKAKI